MLSGHLNFKCAACSPIPKVDRLRRHLDREALWIFLIKPQRPQKGELIETSNRRSAEIDVWQRENPEEGIFCGECVRYRETPSEIDAGLRVNSV